MENKNYKVLIGILVLLVVILIVYIVYSNINMISKNEITKIENFPKENNNGLKTYNLFNYLPNFDELNENMNSTFNLENVKFYYNVEKGKIADETYSKDLYLYANGVEISLIYYFNSKPEIIITDNYIIFQDGDSKYNGNLIIFTKKGDFLKSIGNTKKETIIEDSKCKNIKYIDTTIKVVDNKLYFSESITNTKGITTILFKYIDLDNNLKEYVIQEYQLLCNQDSNN